MVRGLDRFTRLLDWNLLKYFLQIAHKRGIGAAADSLNLSQPSVSVALRRLEEHIGLQLCVRTRKGIVLTAAGEAFLGDCEQILDRIAATPEKLRTIAGEFGGAVYLKTISHMMAPALDAGVVAFKARYPDVELILETGHGEPIVESLLNGDVAIGVGFDESMRRELCHALLLRERQPLYCGASHRLYGQTVEDPAALTDEPFVALSGGEPARLRAFREQYGLGQRIAGLADNIQEAAWLISLGIGIGHLPEPMAEGVKPAVSPLLAPNLAPELDIYLMWRPDLQSRAALRLVETIIEHIEPPTT